MVRELLAICCALLVGPSARTAEAQCPYCGFEVAYWVRGVLSDLNSGACGSLSGNEKLLEDVDLLLNSSLSMLKNGKLYLRGMVGDTGLMGLAGVPGIVGPVGATGYTGNSGSTGGTGDTGYTGPFGAQGLKGAPGHSSSRVKRQAATSVRDKIAPFLAKCPQVSDYFLPFAAAMDDRRAQKATPNPPNKVESGNLKKLINRYEQLSSLYAEVSAAFKKAQSEVAADPRYKGATGFTGGFGFTGVRGVQGQLGQRGQPGYEGSQGARGLTGLNGATGNTGFTGANGLYQ